MKKIFYSILAAAAIVASCVKEPINEPVSPSGDGSSVFTGTIIQPGGIDEATKVSIIGQTSNPDKVYIKWTQNDQIHIIKKGSERWDSVTENDKPKVFYAAGSEATTDFTGTPPDGWIAPDVTYAARYYGKNDVWKNYVLACDAVTPGNLVAFTTIDCKSTPEAAFLENMPLSCGASTYDSGNFRYNFKFSNEYAILQINVPSKLDFEDLYVCVNAQNVEFESEQLKDGSKYTLCLKDAHKVKETEKYKNKDRVTYFVPVSARSYDKLTIVAAKNNAEVARMKTYVGDVKNDGQYVLPELKSNNIYPFDFCNTRTIDEAGTYSLESNNGIDYRVNISADITSDVTINAEVDGKEPANIYINNRGHQISGTLTINASKSHVEGENGIATQVVANTSATTFVVKSTLTITGLTVKKGSVKVEGTESKKANVTTITIPAEVKEQIKIDVSGVSSEVETERVKIINESTEATVVVVPDVVGDEQRSYQVEEDSEPVIEATKETVAMIGTKTYATFAEALAEATSGDVIEVIAATVELPNLNKEGITVKGNGTTKVTKFGGLTKKNITLDGFEFTVETNPSGENFVIKNSKFTGTNGLRWAYAYGEVLIENCIFDTKTYGIHFDSNTGGIVTVKNCEITGFNTFNPLLIFDSCKFVDSKIGNKYYVVQSWSDIVLKNCSFSEKWCDANDYQTIGLTTKTGLAEISNCTFATGTVYDACKNSELGVIAIDATGNATDGFTAGTFVAKQASDIKAAASYEVKAVEGKNNVFTIADNSVAKIGTKGYATLALAVAAAQTGETVEIIKAGDEYTISNTQKAITIEGLNEKDEDGNYVVAFDLQQSHGQNEGITFKHLTFNLLQGEDPDRGFTHCKNLTYNECVFTGEYWGYDSGMSTFNNCVFHDATNYSIWTYGGNITLNDCEFFSDHGKFVNVYATGSKVHTIYANNCIFHNTGAAKKAAFNLKGGNTHGSVVMTNCSVTGNFPNSSTVDGEAIFSDSGLYMFDDPEWSNDVYAKVDGVTYYPYFTIDAQGNYSVDNETGLKKAIKHWNALKAAGEKSITLADGTYNVSDMAIFQNYADKSLLIKAENEKQAVITPNSGSKQLIFVVAGQGKKYSGHITIDGIKFDMSGAAKKDIESDVISISDAVGTNLPADEKALYSGDHHYGHDITIKNCEIIGLGTNNEHSSVVRADGSNGNAYNVKVQDCVIDKVGYVLTSKITTLAEVSGCTITDSKCVINNTADKSEYKVINNSISTYYNYCIRLNFGPVTVSGNTFNCTYSGDADNAGVVVLRGSTGNKATITGNTFIKASGTMNDVYCITSWDVDNGDVTKTIPASKGIMDISKLEELKL